MAQTITVNCPSCNALVPWSQQSTYRPFCCERCQLVDLGEWATEKRAIVGDAVIDDDGIEPY